MLQKRTSITGVLFYLLTTGVISLSSNSGSRFISVSAYNDHGTEVISNDGKTSKMTSSNSRVGYTLSINTMDENGHCGEQKMLKL